MKVDFVGIGAPKAATSWIAQCLAEHPQVCFSRPKEAYLFKGKVSFKVCFQHCRPHQIKGEFSPAYLIQKDIPQELSKHNPGMKLIVSLRNPADRAFSHYLHARALHERNWLNFRDAIEKEPKIRELGFYCKHLKHYLNFFPREQLLVLIYEDIKKDPEQFVKNIYQFLGVDSSFSPRSAALRVSPTNFKLTKLGKAIHKNLGQPAKRHRATQRLKKGNFLRKIYLNFAQFYGRKTASPKISEQDREYLFGIYEEDIRNLGELINRDLSFWHD